MPNMLEQLPVTPTSVLIRSRRQAARRMLLLWAGIQLAACLTIPLALRWESIGWMAGVWVFAGLGIALSFPVSCALFSVLPAFSLAIRFWGTIAGLVFWISAQWLGQVSSHYLQGSHLTSPSPWPVELSGLSLIPLVPAFMLGLTLPLILTQGFHGWRITFPTWEPTGRQPTWSIRGFFLVTFWVAIVLSIAQRNRDYAESSAFLFLASAGISTLLLPIVATILNAKHYLFWFCFTLAALATLSGCCGAFLLGPLVGIIISLLLPSFFGFTCIPLLIARFSGAKLVDNQNSEPPTQNLRHQKMS